MIVYLFIVIKLLGKRQDETFSTFVCVNSKDLLKAVRTPIMSFEVPKRGVSILKLDSR